MVDNIERVVGDESSTFFWRDCWVEGGSFSVKFSRLCDLVENKVAMVLVDMHSRLGGDRRGLEVANETFFSQKEELVKKYSRLSSSLVLQVDVKDMWV